MKSKLQAFVLSDCTAVLEAVLLLKGQDALLAHYRNNQNPDENCCNYKIKHKVCFHSVVKLLNLCRFLVIMYSISNVMLESLIFETA